MDPKPMVVTFSNDSWNLRNESLMEYWGIPVFLKSLSLFYSLEDVPHYFIIRLDIPVHHFWEIIVI